MAFAFASASTAQIGGLKRSAAVAQRASVRLNAKAGSWLPGAESPAWLDGSLPGDFGFDPLGLGKDPEKLSKFQENELMNGRWAMLGAAGIIAVELFGQGSWADAPLWAVKGGSPTYFGVEIPFGDVGLLTVIEIVLMGGVEALRATESDPEKRKYPGGAFDPLNFAKDANNLETLKLKEIKNGRLAMLAVAGFLAQNNVTKVGPLENLKSHLSNPLVNNCGANHVSVPAGAFNLPDFN